MLFSDRNKEKAWKLLHMHSVPHPSFHGAPVQPALCHRRSSPILPEGYSSGSETAGSRDRWTLILMAFANPLSVEDASPTHAPQQVREGSPPRPSPARCGAVTASNTGMKRIAKKLQHVGSYLLCPHVSSETCPWSEKLL